MTNTTRNDLDHETAVTRPNSYWALRKNFWRLVIAAILFSQPPLNASFGLLHGGGKASLKSLILSDEAKGGGLGVLASKAELSSDLFMLLSALLGPNWLARTGHTQP